MSLALEQAGGSQLKDMGSNLQPAVRAEGTVMPQYVGSISVNSHGRTWESMEAMFFFDCIPIMLRRKAMVSI